MNRLAKAAGPRNVARTGDERNRVGLHIEPLTPDDTGAYIRMRLRRAGCDRELFTSDTIALVHEATLGSMRDIDRIATATLRDAARKKRKLVERDLASRILTLDSRAEA